MESTNALYMHDLIALIYRKILVKIVPVFSAENRLTNGNCTATRLQFDNRLLFVVLASTIDWNYDFSILIGCQFSTSFEILVRFS